MYFVRFNYFGLVSFAYVVGQVVLDIVGELLLVFGVQPQHFHQAQHVNAFQVAVRQGFDVATGLDHGVAARPAHGVDAAGRGARVARPAARSQPRADVAPDQIAFA